MLRDALKRVPLAQTAWALFRLADGRNARFTEDYAESSGVGSDLGITQKLVAELPALLRSLEIEMMLDIPCGDFVWMSRVELGGIDYLGADVIESLIGRLQQQHPGRRFQQMDLVTDDLPTVDLLFCRDCLVHLSERLVKQAVRNVQRSGSTYLMATTFPNQQNVSIITGQWRPINLCAAPFNFPPPIHLLNEGHPQPYPDKSMGVWRIADLPSD